LEKRRAATKLISRLREDLARLREGMPRELMNAAPERLAVTALELNAGVGSRFKDRLRTRYAGLSAVVPLHEK
jgi:hypothetical protein